MNEVDGVSFDLKKSEIANLEKLGLVPMVNEYGKVIFFCQNTFQRDNLGLQTYSVVRVFDYIAKFWLISWTVVLSRRWNSKAGKRPEISNASKFLDSWQVLINWSIIQIMGRTGTLKPKDRIYLDIHMDSHFLRKNFMIKMDGHKGMIQTLLMEC